MKTWLEIGSDGTSVYVYRQKDDGRIEIAHDVEFKWYQTAEGAFSAPSFVLQRDKRPQTPPYEGVGE